MNPLVSIIIPCYNAERYVGEAIESALGQTYPHVEVVVIDDGSTDGSLDVIKSFGDRIRWETGPNRGGCAARNRGLELARGDLIQFLDSDDLLKPEKLQRQVPLAVARRPDVVYCNYETEWLGGISGKAMQSPACGDLDSVVFVLRRRGLQTSAPLHWRENLVRVGGFCEDLPCAQERDLHLRLACTGLRFHHLPETLYTVRRLGGSVSSDSVRVLDQHAGIAQGAYKLLEQSGGLTEERRAALAGFLAADARAYLNHGRPEKAREYFELARRMHPEGGIPQAYSGRTRWLYHTLGPILTQRLVGWKRNLQTGFEFGCREFKSFRHFGNELKP